MSDSLDSDPSAVNSNKGTRLGEAQVEPGKGSVILSLGQQKRPIALVSSLPTETIPFGKQLYTKGHDKSGMAMYVRRIVKLKEFSKMNINESIRRLWKKYLPGYGRSLHT
jgi:hypothetical protein